MEIYFCAMFRTGDIKALKKLYSLVLGWKSVLKIIYPFKLVYPLKCY